MSDTPWVGWRDDFSPKVERLMGLMGVCITGKGWDALQLREKWVWGSRYREDEGEPFGANHLLYGSTQEGVALAEFATRIKPIELAGASIRRTWLALWGDFAVLDDEEGRERVAVTLEQITAPPPAADADDRRIRERRQRICYEFAARAEAMKLDGILFPSAASKRNFVVFGFAVPTAVEVLTYKEFTAS